MICYAKLNIPFDIEGIREEISEVLNSDKWIAHFNKRDYDGDWHILPLRSPGGLENNPFADLINQNHYENTALLNNLPVTKNILNTFKCEIQSVRLLNLKAGAVIKQHRDHELAFENGEARLHLPIFTNNDVEFYVDDERVIMPEGSCWYINANLPHRVANYGESDRIHLVIDCKVSDWMEGIFDKAEKRTREEKLNVEELNLIIQSLRLQNNPVSEHYANELENTLKNYLASIALN